MINHKTALKTNTVVLNDNTHNTQRSYIASLDNNRRLNCIFYRLSLYCRLHQNQQNHHIQLELVRKSLTSSYKKELFFQFS